MSLVPFLYLIPAVVILVLLVLSGDEKLPEGGGDQTEGFRGRFTRIGQFIYRRLPVFRKPGHGAQVATNLGVLRPRVSADEAKRLYYADKIGMTLLILFAGSVLATLVSFSARREHVLDENGHLTRHGYGGGAREETLVLSINGARLENEIPITVTERQYTREQADALFAEATASLPEAIAGRNASLDEVRDDLNLVSSLEGYPFEITWRVSDYSLIHADGKLQTENLKEEGETVMLTAQFDYLKDHWETELPVCLYPPLYSQEELWEQGVQKLLEQADQATVSEAYMVLPEQIGGNTWSWAGKVKDDASLLFLMILVTAGAVFVMKDKDLEKQAREREEEMNGDYPQFVTKLVLYLGAGMTVRNVFGKLAADYNEKLKNGGETRYLYEEIYRVVNELESGVSEATAYEHFSLRCRSQPYTRLCTLLTQNLRKGAAGLMPLLKEESKKALAGRMDLARRKGEEAGTRLLLPMMLMLVIVMVIIMIPAYLSF